MMKITCPFPYKPRLYQAEIIRSIYETFEKRGHLILESGTGTGKTIVALAPAVEYACKNGKKVLYLTRTNSQQRQVIHELRAIFKKVQGSQNTQKVQNETFFGMGLQGRQNMCPFVKKDAEYKNCTAEELARMCKFRKEETEILIEKGIKKFPDERKACPYYFKFVLSNKTKEENTVPEIIKWAKETIPHPEEINQKCDQLGICPYEINKLLVKDATIVCAPYIYLLHPGIKNRLLDWLGVSMQNLIVIVDEAQIYQNMQEKHALLNSLHELLQMQFPKFSNITIPKFSKE